MDPEEDFNRFRYRARVQAVAVIDILVGTIPFINLAFDFNNKDLADKYPEREMLVLFWSVLLCVYVLQLIMGVWLLAATREVYSEYTVGNCQVWFYVAMFSFVFYSGEMAYDISSIIKTPPQNRDIKQVLLTMLYHAAKIIYRAFTLMIVNNFLYDICRPVHRYLTQGSYQYKYYCHERLGLPLPSRRMSMAALNQAFPIQRIPSFTTYSTFPQLRHKVKVNNNVTANNVAVHRFPQAAPPRPPRVPVVQPPYHSYPRYAHSQKTFNQENRIAK